MGAYRFHNQWKRIRPNVWQICLARQPNQECQAFRWWGELGVDCLAIPPRVRTIPSEAWKQDRIQPVQAKATTFVIEAEALVAQACRDAVGPEQGREKMTLGVAEAATFDQNF